MRHVFATLTALSLTAACMHTGKASGPRAEQPAAPRPAATSPAEAEALVAFSVRLKEYVALHDRLEKTLPPLPKEADAQTIEKHQRALAQLIGDQRKNAKRGDIFTPEGERVIRKLLADVIAKPGGAALKATIMDENPVGLKLTVNQRYADDVPLSTVPPQTLAVLPKLPEELEYRFIGHRLILLDIHAHTVADYVENALPL